MFNTKYPYTCSATSYETDNIKITTNVNKLDVFSLVFEIPATSSSSWSADSYLIFEFKSKLITPALLSFTVTDWQTGYSNVYEDVLHVDYYINNTWKEQVTYTIPAASYTTRNFEIELPHVATTQIRIRITQSKGGPSIKFSNMYVGFTTDSPVIKNKVSATIMQNEFFQSVLPTMEVE